MTKDIEFVVKSIADTALKNEQYFTELDAVVGDGDFGYSIARGFEKTLEKWDEIDRTDPGTFLKEVAKIIMASVGGVSGSIWGTAFLRAG
ncbi:MAG: DAK2 domain-containing protein, partial [Chloroflexi bacterium]|nr:DAK2 domain-containing protein [Chloroflexota bacterium]